MCRQPIRDGLGRSATGATGGTVRLGQSPPPPTAGPKTVDWSVVSVDDRSARKRMRLRYRGSCRLCGLSVEAGQWAVYIRNDKQIECISCHDGHAPAEVSAPTVADPAAGGDDGHGDCPVDVGTAGASARREYQRRATKREQRIRAAHPRLGGLILAMSDEPQSTRAWDRGARGEELLAKRLDGLSEHGVLVLHDRRIRGTRANIDHIAVSSAGVFVIDAKRYQGRPSLKIEGGLFRPRTEKLLVGRRDCTRLVDGVDKQVALVRDVFAKVTDFGQVPVQGMLCFVEADWPLIGGAFSVNGVRVLWPAKAAEHITTNGPLTAHTADALHRHLAAEFPTA